jgi:hypothetical protein
MKIPLALLDMLAYFLEGYIILDNALPNNMPAMSEL